MSHLKFLIMRLHANQMEENGYNPYVSNVEFKYFIEGGRTHHCEMRVQLDKVRTWQWGISVHGTLGDNNQCSWNKIKVLPAY